MNRHKNIGQNILLVIIIFLITSCEEKTNWNLQTSGRKIIVDALLTSDLKNQEVKVYYSSTGLNEKPEPISGATIKLIGKNTIYLFKEADSLAGFYISDIPFRCATGIWYQLIVDAEGSRDTATADMEAITPLQQYKISDYDSLYRFTYINDDIPSFTEIFYDWSLVPDYCNSYGFCTASETYYTLNNLDVSKIIAPKKQVICFPRGTQIIRKKYSLSKQHQEFIRSLLLETEWRGGVFDVEQGNVTTNFHHGMRGWFGVCTVLSDTIHFQ